MGSCWISSRGGGEGVAFLSFILAAVFKEHREIPEVGLYNTSLTR